MPGGSCARATRAWRRPRPRPADAFDPGAKYHVPGNTPYARYFLAFIYEFQFYRAACREAGWQGPLHRCSVYGNKARGREAQRDAGDGPVAPWPETLAAFTGETDIDASAIRDYFAPLDAWLTEQNRGGGRDAQVEGVLRAVRVEYRNAFCLQGFRLPPTPSC